MKNERVLVVSRALIGQLIRYTVCIGKSEISRTELFVTKMPSSNLWLFHVDCTQEEIQLGSIYGLHCVTSAHDVNDRPIDGVFVCFFSSFRQINKLFKRILAEYLYRICPNFGLYKDFWGTVLLPLPRLIRLCNQHCVRKPMARKAHCLGAMQCL